MMIPCNEALHVARLDAEQAYGDLTLFRITLVLEQDGWHVDYDLRNLTWNGGGPHYVIDSHTGTIVSKQYDQ